MTDARSRLPAVHRLLATDAGRQLTERFGRAQVRDALRRELATLREALRPGENTPGVEELLSRLETRLVKRIQEGYPEVVNATGVLIHTNLGRAPRLGSCPGGYLALEMDLDSGGRGERLAPVVERLCRYLGAEAATVVTNNAAALVLLLAAHAAGKEVLVSRGELIEIGGSFRLPDIMAAAGTRLVEVGCTNRTRLADYENAITDDTAGILSVHRSNFAMTGFVASPGIAELASLARRAGLPLWVDQGSGCHMDLKRYGLQPETTVQEHLRAGADAVLFSGDKLLGGPQAGIIVGRESAVTPLRHHPLRRALRPDKAALVSLAQTLDTYLAEQPDCVPLYRLLAEPEASLRRRARRLARKAAAVQPGVRAVPSRAVLGGGTTPDQTIPSWAVELPDRQELLHWLRRGDPPVLARAEGGRLLVDLRAVFPEQDPLLEAALVSALNAFSS